MKHHSRINRLLGKTTLASEIIESNKAKQEAEASAAAKLEEARQEDLEANSLDEGLEDDMAKLVKKIASSSPNNLKAAAKAAKEMGDDLSNSMSERPVWKAVAAMLKTASK